MKSRRTVAWGLAVLGLAAVVVAGVQYVTPRYNAIRNLLELRFGIEKPVAPQLDGPVETRTIPTPDPRPAVPQTTAFPRAISADGRFFVDQSGDPWFGLGDAAWSLAAQLTQEEVFAYLDDRARRGFNLVLFNVIERKFGNNAPRNVYGEGPFVSDPFLSQPNEAYWAHIDRIVEAAQDRGITLLICPAYLGARGTRHGWHEEVAAVANEDMARYGRFLASRYGRYPNVMWLIGHDRVPDEVEKEREIALAEALPQDQLLGYGAVFGTSSLGRLFWRPTTVEADFETVYNRADFTADHYDPHSSTTEAWKEVPTRPVLFLEGRYEQEGGYGFGEEILRYELWEPFLDGASAVIFGNNPIWNFQGKPSQPYRGSWFENMSSAGSVDAETFGRLVRALPWETLEPGTSAGPFTFRGTEASGPVTVPTRQSDTLAVAYLRSGGEVSIESSNLEGGAFEVERIDPTTGARSSLGSYEAGSVHTVRLPELNAAGHRDWVLLAAPARGVQ